MFVLNCAVFVLPLTGRKSLNIKRAASGTGRGKNFSTLSLNMEELSELLEVLDFIQLKWIGVKAELDAIDAQIHSSVLTQEELQNAISEQLVVKHKIADLQLYIDMTRQRFLDIVEEHF